MGAAPGADGRADPQALVGILAGVRKFVRLLDVLDRDHAAQFEVVTDNEDFFDPVFVQQADDFVLFRVFADRDESFLRRHDLFHRFVKPGLEAQIAARNDPDDLLAIDNRDPRKAPRAGQREHLADGHVRGYRDRIADHAALEFLHLRDLRRLFGQIHVLVDDADPAGLRERNRESRFGDRIHGRGDERDLQVDFARQAGPQFDLSRQDVRVIGREEDVVERQRFAVNAHGVG